MTELCPNQGVYSTTRLALHPDGTPMISIGPAVDLSKPSPALDPEHSRQCLAVPPPADGEVAELLAWLKLQIDRHTHWAQSHDRTQLGRLIALLERQQPQPVPDKLPERLTVQEISDLPQHGENYIYSGDRSPDEIELDGAFSRADLQQLANSLSTSRSNSAMSDYYGGATLEDWLQEEVFRTREPLPSLVVSLFECWREGIEANIRAWMESDDGDGNHLSWRGWGRGFYAVADSDESRFDNAVRQGRLMISSNLQND